MQIQYISDIHLELLHIEECKSIMRKIIPVVDILILAGDIGNPYSEKYKLFLEDMNSKFKKVFIIAGNHEYYSNGYTIDETNSYIVELVKQYSNISFLQNTFEDYNNLRFIGCTCWSYIDNPYNKINDTVCIKNLTVDSYNEMYKKSEKFITNTLDMSIKDNIQSIIITHHIPTKKLIHEKYLNKEMLPYSQWFAGNLDEIMIKYNSNIKGWFYGHTHTESTVKLYDVLTFCNPVGYKRENHKVDYNKIVEIK